MSNLVFDSRNTEYKHPFGAVSELTPVHFRVCLPIEFTFSEVVLNVYSSYGELTRIYLCYQKTQENHLYYKCEFVPKTPDVYYYHFSITLREKTYYIKKTHSSIGEICENEQVGCSFQLTVYKKGAKTPESIKGGIIYQIFPDRFYFSGTQKPNVPKDRLLRADFFSGQPNFALDENGVFKSDDYFCGDLEGIEKKLPYLKSLGVTIIYLNPIFEAHSNHRYNTADYLKIDPLLGSEEDFKRLCDKAKKLDIKIILDGVFNHTGDDSVYFNKKGRYNGLGAYNSKESPYFSWYVFHDFPNNYLSWWGFDTLPTINKNSQEFEKFICDKVIPKWLDAGASGFRLDVVDELNGSFVEKINKAIKSHNEENYIVGEVWEDASNKEAYGEKKRYLLGDQLDGVMNYPFRNAIIDFLRRFNKQDFINNVMTVVENYPPQNLNVVMNLLSSHDVERILTSIAGEPFMGGDRNWQSRHHLSLEQYKEGVNLLKCAFTFQYFLPGLPCVYYGDEAGLEGYKDPFNRKCYPWNNEDKDILEFVKKLGKLRHNLKSFLKDGTLSFIESPNDILAFARKSGKKELIVYLNYSKSPQTIEFNTKMFKLRHGELNFNKQIALPPYSFALISN